MNFREWLYTCNNLKTNSCRRYYKEVYGSSRLNELACSLELRPLHTYSSLEEFNAARAVIFASKDFKTFNSSGNRMYSAALNRYAEYLAFLEHNDLLAEDQAELENRRDLSATQKEMLIRARIGQGLYRKKVLDRWNGCCAVTGFASPVMLLASHIKPWRICSDEERLDADNGLALSPTLDRAFDQGLVTFDGVSGRILFSPHFRHYELLGLSTGMKLLRVPSRQMRTYLEYHESHIFLAAAD